MTLFSGHKKLADSDEANQDDLEAAGDYYENLLNESLPNKQAERIAFEEFGINLNAGQINRIMEQYACTQLSIDDCVRSLLQRSGLI